MKAWILIGLISCAKKNTAPEEHPASIEHTPIEMPEKKPEVEPDPELPAPSTEDLEENYEGGIIGGVAGGVIGGKLGGSLSNGESSQSIHWSEVTIKRKQKPKFPQEAVQLNITEASCIVKFFIDKKGIPERVNIRNCPEIFHESVRKAAMTWRFHPVQIKEENVKATFMLRIKFRHR